MESSVTHRYYENKFPKVNDFVVVQLLKYESLGVTCKLVEYNFIDGFIPTQELTHQRYRSVRQSLKIGGKHDEVALVLRVDEDKGTFRCTQCTHVLLLFIH